MIGVEDVNKKLDVEVNAALEPVDQELSEVRSTLDSQIQRNSKLKVVQWIVQYRSGSVAERLACWTRAQKGPSSNRSRDAVG